MPNEDPASSLKATIDLYADSVRRGRRRREFLKRLGLTVPVTVEDVKRAYYEKARKTHPDHKGNASEFLKVQEAFDKAIEFAKRNGKRIPWIGAQTPIYVAQLAVIELVEEWGGKFVVEHLEWLEGTIGEDFALLADRLTEIDLSGCEVGDKEVEQLTSEPDGVAYVEVMGLANTRVTSAALPHIARAPSLKVLDLRGTRVPVGERRRLAKTTPIEVAGGSRFAELTRRLFGY